jgi:dipeptidyl aminopeptidase/acylaminoacyl peptidase
MHTDLLDAIDHLAAHGIIDPARVAIVGGSYGGCAALVGATFTRTAVMASAELDELIVADADALRAWLANHATSAFSLRRRRFSSAISMVARSSRSAWSCRIQFRSAS